MKKDNDLKINHEQFKKILKECQILRWKKLNDYGLSYNEYGFIGLLVKIADKSSRIKHIHINKKHNFENMRDSLIDLINYSIMAIMELDDDNRK